MQKFSKNRAANSKF